MLMFRFNETLRIGKYLSPKCFTLKLGWKVFNPFANMPHYSSLKNIYL